MASRFKAVGIKLDALRDRIIQGPDHPLSDELLDVVDVVHELIAELESGSASQLWCISGSPRSWRDAGAKDRERAGRKRK